METFVQPKITGYRQLNEAEAALMNEIKARGVEPEDLMAEIAKLDGPKSMDRNRPYDGQAHTDQGVRGRQPITGLTFRDLNDCFIRAVLLSACHIAGMLFIILTVWGTAYSLHFADSWMYVPIGVSAIVFLALGVMLLFDGL